MSTTTGLNRLQAVAPALGDRIRVEFGSWFVTLVLAVALFLRLNEVQISSWCFSRFAVSDLGGLSVPKDFLLVIFCAVLAIGTE